MKKITMSALMVLAGALSVTSALAQGDEVRANVPFAFALDNKVMPAGHYEIAQVSDQQLPGGLLVRNIDQPRYSVMVIGSEGACHARPNYVTGKPVLIFDNYDGHYFLREVRGAQAGLNLDIPKSKAEDSAKENQMASNATQTIIAGQ